MLRILLVFFIYSIPIFTANAETHVKLNQNNLNTSQIEQLTGAKGQLDSQENVFKVSVPRDDLHVIAAGVKLVPAMGLTSWVSFKEIDHHLMLAVGGLVLSENQVNPVMSVALNNGLHVTALHNHFFWDSPKVMFMNINGIGSETRLASAIGKVFSEIKLTSSDQVKMPFVDIDPDKTTLNPQIIDAILGTKGTLKNGVYKIVVGRTAQMDDHLIGSTMGINTWAAFAGSDAKAVVVGDFAMHESELQNVLKALRHAGIYIVAIHNHMTGEQPRFIFLHYWGIGSVKELASGLRGALNITKDYDGK